MRYAVILAVMLGMLAVILGMLMGTAVQAAELSSAIMSLRGREVVDVFPVAYSSPAVARVIRRTEKTMTSVVVNRLNKAQVAASQVNPAILDPSTLALVVTIDFLEIPELRVYVFTVRGTVEQVAQLYSPREVSSVTTWSHMDLGLIADAPGGGIRIWESVDAVVDRFIKDWKTAQKAKRVGPKPYGDLFGKVGSSSDAGDDFIQDNIFCRNIVNALPLEKFLEVLPDATEDHNNSRPDVGYRAYETPLSASYGFLDGKLISITLNSPKDPDVIAREFDKYRAAFGAPDSTDVPPTTLRDKGATRSATWYRPENDLAVGLAVLPGTPNVLSSHWHAMRKGAEFLRRVQKLDGSDPFSKANE